MAKQAYLSQVAADEGRLELCRFLLQESSLFQQDEITNYTRRALLEYAGKRIDSSNGVRFVEEAMHLFPTANVMEADFDLETFAALGEFHDGYHLQWGSLLPLAQIPIAKVPFVDRFAIAMESFGWRADFFEATFADDEWTMLATQANEEGKTALHWALESYAFFSDDVDRAGRYASLAIRLIRRGSNVHSRGKQRSYRGGFWNESPLTTLLDYACFHGRLARLSEVVDQWGQMLVEAGISLPSYAATENVYIRANRPAVYAQHGKMFFMAELEVSAHGKLAMRAKSTIEVPIWKVGPRQVPGEWPVSPSPPSPVNRLPEVPDTITWVPKGRENREGFRWFLAGSVSISSPSFLVESPETIESHGLDYSDGSAHPYEGYKRVRQANDDSSVIAAINDEEFRQRIHTLPRHRSASAPAIGRRDRPDSTTLYLPGPWNGTIHKCALDMRWKMSSMAEPSLRDCMQARCREWMQSFERSEKWWWHGTWEANLLRDERQVHVAKRFALRFCPEYLHVLDATLARVTERARLAMGPARPPVRSW